MILVWLNNFFVKCSGSEIEGNRVFQYFFINVGTDWDIKLKFGVHLTNDQTIKKLIRFYYDQKFLELTYPSSSKTSNDTLLDQFYAVNILYCHYFLPQQILSDKELKYWLKFFQCLKVLEERRVRDRPKSWSKWNFVNEGLKKIKFQFQSSIRLSFERIFWYHQQK